MKIACVQTDVAFRQPMLNAERACRHLKELHDEGVELAVFPEAFLTGYCFASREAALASAIDRSDPSLRQIQETANSLGILTIVGFAERTETDELYNTAAIFDPGQRPNYYRKVHLPELGYDHFAGTGDELRVFETTKGKIGVLICFDLRIPEATRTLALRGAELIALPTNWPTGAEVSADHNTITRAAENRVFLAACNRVGEEEGFSFIGKSKIVSPTGKVLAVAGSGAEVIMADVDLAEARTKRTVTIPGQFEIEVFATRKPELYGPITEKK